MKKLSNPFPSLTFLAVLLFWPAVVKADAAATAIYDVGVQIGFAELGAQQRVLPSTLVQTLTFAEDSANRSGCIASAEIARLRVAMSNTSDSLTLYQSILSYRMRLAGEVQKNCRCGGNRAQALWSTGVQIGYAELGSFLNIRSGQLVQTLTLARDWAYGTGCISLNELENLIRAMRRTRDSRSLYQSIQSYRLRLGLEVLRNCSCGGGGCTPFHGVWTDTSFGTTITFQRIGNRVTGRYVFRGIASSISGVVSGNVLEGEYFQPGYPDARYQRGRLRFVINPDGRSWNGRAWDVNGGNEQPWNGVCPRR